MRLSSYDMEDRVTRVLARLAGVSTALIKPDLRLEDLGCDSWRKLDLVEVLESELGVTVCLRQPARAGDDPLPKPASRLLPETVWDVVKLFHRAHTAGPCMRLPVPALDEAFAQPTIRVGELLLRIRT